MTQKLCRRTPQFMKLVVSQKQNIFYRLQSKLMAALGLVALVTSISNSEIHSSICSYVHIQPNVKLVNIFLVPH